MVGLPLPDPVDDTLALVVRGVLPGEHTPEYPSLGYPKQGTPTDSVGRSIYTPEHRRLVQLLVELRRDAGLRQVELAKRLDRPQSFVSKYESGQRRLDLVELRAICTALGVGLVETVEWYEQALAAMRQQGRRRRGGRTGAVDRSRGAEP